MKKKIKPLMYKMTFRDHTCSASMSHSRYQVAEGLYPSEPKEIGGSIAQVLMEQLEDVMYQRQYQWESHD
jgi:hypothetical protein